MINVTLLKIPVKRTLQFPKPYQSHLSLFCVYQPIKKYDVEIPDYQSIISIDNLIITKLSRPTA